MSGYKNGPTFPISVNADGIPLCMHCFEPMIEVEPNVWQCALGKAQEDAVARALGVACERLAADMGIELEEAP